MTVLLRCENLAASYARRPIFDHVTLALGAGLHAVQGPNGSGKSTLLRVLAGAQAPDRGEVWIDGIHLDRDPLEARRRLSYAPDESPIYPFVTAREFLAFVAAAKRAGQLDDLADELGLSPHLDSRVDAMSLGTQKKLLLCAAAIGNPRVMLLDEPGNGLDEAARGVLVDRFRGWSREAAILFVAHDADFVAATGASVIAMADLLAAGSAAAAP